MIQGTGKYTVITGASSGIGYEAAKAFAEPKMKAKVLAPAATKTEFGMVANIFVCYIFL